ncbi:MAG: hypothetical protein ACW98D_08760 [Promethearchaeota archaeon]|jgi:hypothetical protein
MGLDKWLKSEDADKKPKSKKKALEKDIKSSSKKNVKTDLEKPSSKLIRYSLTCTNSKCKFQKIFMKKQLTEMDKICPRCKKEMKVK